MAAVAPMIHDPHDRHVAQITTRRSRGYRDVCTFLNEDYTPGMSAMKDTPRHKGKEASAAFIGGFRQMMSKRQIAFMQAHAKRDMVAYDYELEPVRFSPGDYLLFYLIDQPVNLACMVTWRALKGLQLKFPAQMGLTPPPRLMSI